MPTPSVAPASAGLLLALALRPAAPRAADAAHGHRGAIARAATRQRRRWSACARMAVDDARSAATLGRARQGSGVVIGAGGLVLTIGYLMLEAEQVQLVTDDEREVPARVVGYDVATGFGLVQALAPLRIEPVPLRRRPRRWRRASR